MVLKHAAGKAAAPQLRRPLPQQRFWRQHHGTSDEAAAHHARQKGRALHCLQAEISNGIRYTA